MSYYLRQNRGTAIHHTSTVLLIPKEKGSNLSSNWELERFSEQQQKNKDENCSATFSLVLRKESVYIANLTEIYQNSIEGVEMDVSVYAVVQLRGDHSHQFLIGLWASTAFLHRDWYLKIWATSPLGRISASECCCGTQRHNQVVLCSCCRYSGTSQQTIIFRRKKIGTAFSQRSRRSGMEPIWACSHGWWLLYCLQRLCNSLGTETGRQGTMFTVGYAKN